MKTAIFCLFLLLAGQAQAATAFFTGNQQSGRSVTGAWVTNCEYRYNGQTFWRAFQGTCPSSIDIM